MTNEMMQPTAAFGDLVKESFQPLFGVLQRTMTELLSSAHRQASDFPQHLIEQLALSVVGQCLYYRVGHRVVEILVPLDRRQSHYDLESLSRHILSVALAAIENPNFLSGQHLPPMPVSGSAAGHDIVQNPNSPIERSVS